MGSDESGLRLVLEDAPKTSRQVSAVTSLENQTVPSINGSIAIMPEVHKEALQKNLSRANAVLNAPAASTAATLTPRPLRAYQPEPNQQEDLLKPAARIVKPATVPTESQIQQSAYQYAALHIQKNFDPSRTAAPTKAQITQFLEANKEAFKANAELAEKALEDYKKAYAKAFEDRYMQMPWYKRQYYTVIRSTSGLLSSVGKAADYLTSGAVLEDIGSVAESAKGFVRNSIKSVESVLPGTESIYQKLEKAVSAATTFMQENLATVKEIIKNPGSTFSLIKDRVYQIGSDIYNADWKGIGQGVLEFGGALVNLGKVMVTNLGKGLYYAGSKIAEAAVYTWNNPGKVFWGAVAVGGAVLRFAGDILYSTGQFALQIISDPMAALRKVGSFIKAVSDSIGLTDLLVGGWNGVLALKELAMGNPFEAGRRGKEALRVFKGAFVALGEFTGVSDLGRAVYYLSRGEFGMAAFHGAMGGAQLAVLVTSLGLMNIVTTPTKKAAMEAMKLFAKESGKEVVEALQKVVTNEMLDQAGKRSAIQGTKPILKMAPSTITAPTVRGAVREGTDKVAVNLMKEHGADELIETNVFELLKSIKGSSRRGLRDELIKLGTLSKKEARYLAKSLKRVVKIPGSRNSNHTLLEEVLTDGITAEIKQDFMDRGMKEGFDRIWNKAIGAIQKYHNLPDEYMPLLKKAGQEGFEEGMESGIKKVVKEAVEAAFRRFRGDRTNQDYQVDQLRQKKKEDLAKKQAEQEKELQKKDTDTDEESRRFRKKDQNQGVKRDQNGEVIVEKGSQPDTFYEY